MVQTVTVFCHFRLNWNRSFSPHPWRGQGSGSVAGSDSVSHWRTVKQRVCVYLWDFISVAAAAGGDHKSVLSDLWPFPDFMVGRWGRSLVHQLNSISSLTWSFLSLEKQPTWEDSPRTVQVADPWHSVSGLWWCDLTTVSEQAEGLGAEQSWLLRHLECLLSLLLFSREGDVGCCSTQSTKQLKLKISQL